MDIETDSPPPTVPNALRWFIAAFLVFSVGGALLLKSLLPGWIGVAIYVVVMMAMAAQLMRSVQKAGAHQGCGSPAINRYNRRMLWSSWLYMIGLFGAIALYRNGYVSGLLLWPIALAPTIGVLGMVWAMGRLLVEETDEYLRFRMVRQALFACGGLLALSTVWGFLEQFELVVHIPAWASVPVFAIMLGIGQAFRWVRT